MHNLMLFTLAPLVIASDLSKRFALLPRQGNDAFIPGTAGVVYNCANPCGGDCIFPDEGDTCCVENYGCPGGNFCLTKGYCCPDGDDPATCARDNGITLPSGFKASQTIAAGASSSTAAPVSPTSAIVASSSPPTTRVSSSPASVTPVFTSSTTAPFPTPVTNATLAPPSSTTSASAPGGSVVPFTGGAMRFAVDGAAAVAVFGVIGLLV